MNVKMELTRLECAAMVETNITATWPTPPGYKWTAKWEGYADHVTVTCEKQETDQDATKEDEVA